jgi:hypothetical protein
MLLCDYVMLCYFIVGILSGIYAAASAYGSHNTSSSTSNSSSSSSSTSPSNTYRHTAATSTSTPTPTTTTTMGIGGIGVEAPKYRHYVRDARGRLVRGEICT